ncbi:MAG: Ig-like domain-containing protein, partial [Planctomycetota bacterium]
MSQSVLRAVGLLTFALALPLGGCDEKIMQETDNSPPSVSISDPADGADVSGVAFRVQVDATDAGSGIDRVEFRV